MTCMSPQIDNLIEQTVIFSAKLIKYNDLSKRQQRLLVLTPTAIYNLLSTQSLLSKLYPKNRIRRCIQLSKLDCISVSKQGFEFILHVRDEYDYRYSSSEQKEQIIHSIVEAYCKLTGKKSFPVYYQKQRFSLENLVTTKQDLKKRVFHRPKEGKIDYNPNQKADHRDQVLFKRMIELLSHTISDFQMINVISKGAFGKVMLCTSKLTKQLFVIKSQRQQEMSTSSRIERKIMEMVSNRFILPLQYTLQSEGKIFFLTRFINCGDLYQLLEKTKTLEQHQAKFIIAQILLALDYLHSNGVVHRDIKLENVLISANGYIQVIDFGVASLMNKHQFDDQFAGTPQYMAPQLVSGKKYNFAVDYWSLGIILHEFMYGIAPFTHGIQSQLFKKIRFQPVQLAKTIINYSPSACDFCERLLTKNPKSRLSSLGQAKSHCWFKDFKWDKLEKGEQASPITPQPIKVQKMRVSDEFWHQKLCSPIYPVSEQSKPPDRLYVHEEVLEYD